MTNLDNSIMQNLAPIFEKSKSAILELNNHIPRTNEVLQSYRRLLESIIDMHAQLIKWEQKYIFREKSMPLPEDEQEWI